MSGNGQMIDGEEEEFFDAYPSPRPSPSPSPPRANLHAVEPPYQGPKLSPYAPMPKLPPPSPPITPQGSEHLAFHQERHNPETSLPPPTNANHGGFALPQDHRKSYPNPPYNNSNNMMYSGGNNTDQYLMQQQQPQQSFQNNSYGYSQSVPNINFHGQPQQQGHPLGDMLAPPSMASHAPEQPPTSSYQTTPHYQSQSIPPAPPLYDGQSTAGSASSAALDSVDLGSHTSSSHSGQQSSSQFQSYQSQTMNRTTAAADQSNALIPETDDYNEEPNIYGSAYQTTAFRVNYEDEPASTHRLPQRTVGTRGDSTLRPNTGMTNSYDYALWGLAPHELLRLLQRLNMFASLACVVIASLSWLGELVFLQLEKVVLLAYLAVLSFALGMVELMATVTPEQQRLIPNNLMGRIRDQLGFLFHPWGKSLFVLLLATMCWGIGGIFLSLAGTVYLISSLAWFYAAVAYREDLPRLMGSIDATYDSEARRLNGQGRTFSISSWDALMRGQAHVLGGAAASAAQTSWANWINPSTSHEDSALDTNAEDAGERTSLVGNTGANS